MNEQTESLIGQIEEGLQNLKEITNFKELRHSNRVWEVESALGNFKRTKDQEALNHLLQVYRSTNIAMEGDDAYGETIWNANVQMSGKMGTLEDKMDELDDLRRKETNER